MRFLFLLLLFPLLEIAGFILVGDALGVGNTLLLVILGAVLGVIVLRDQGLGILRRLQERSAQGEPPVREAFDGICVAISGLLLIIPGFFSDAFALLLFLPPVRTYLFGRLAVAAVNRRAGWQGQSSRQESWQTSGRPPQPRPRGSVTVLEADYVEIQGAGDNVNRIAHQQDNTPAAASDSAPPDSGPPDNGSGSDPKPPPNTSTNP